VYTYNKYSENISPLMHILYIGVLYVRNGQKRKNKGFIFIVAIIVLLIYGFLIVDRNIKPTVLAISEVKEGVTLSPLARWYSVMKKCSKIKCRGALGHYFFIEKVTN